MPVPDSTGLTMRQFDRDAIELRAEFVVDPAHGEQVRFSASSGAADTHVAWGTAVDISGGGVGILCRQFIPRMTEGLLRVFGPETGGSAEGGAPLPEAALVHRVKVRRVRLASHDPTYALGLAFVNAEQQVERQVADLLALARQTQSAASEPRGAGDA